MTSTGIKFEPKSLLAFVVSVTLMAVLLGTAVGNTALAAAAWPILTISGIVWLIFVALAIARNFGRR